MRCFACSTLHVLLPGVSGDNKNGRVGRFFFCRMHRPPVLLSTGGSPSVWRLCRWMGKVNAFLFSLSLCSWAINSILSRQCSTGGGGREWDLNLFHAPLPSSPSEVDSFPAFWCTGLDWFEDLDWQLIPGNFIQTILWMDAPSSNPPPHS